MSNSPETYFKTLQDLKEYYENSSSLEQNRIQKYFAHAEHQKELITLAHKPISNLTQNSIHKHIRSDLQFLHFLKYDFSQGYDLPLSTENLLYLLTNVNLEMKDWFQYVTDSIDWPYSSSIRTNQAIIDNINSANFDFIGLEQFKTILTYFNLSIFSKIENCSLYAWINNPEVILYIYQEGLDPYEKLIDLFDTSAILILQNYIDKARFSEEEILNILNNGEIDANDKIAYLWKVVIFNDYFSFELIERMIEWTNLRNGNILDGKEIKNYFAKWLTEENMAAYFEEFFENNLDEDIKYDELSYIFMEILEIYGFAKLSLEQLKKLFSLNYPVECIPIMNIIRCLKKEKYCSLTELKNFIQEKNVQFCQPEGLTKLAELFINEDREGLKQFKNYFEMYWKNEYLEEDKDEDLMENRPEKANKKYWNIDHDKIDLRNLIRLIKYYIIFDKVNNQKNMISLFFGEINN